MPEIKIFKAEEVLFQECDLPNTLYILKRGAVSIRKAYGTSQSPLGIEIAKITSGEVLGELSFFDRQPRSASAIAIIETEALELSFQELDLLFRQIPEYMHKIIESIVGRLRKANSQLSQLRARLERS